VDRFERMLTLLRRGQSDSAEQLRAETPGAWLPRWVAGEPLSPALRQAHQLGSQIRAVRLDDSYAWAMTGDAVYRIARPGGEVHRLGLDGPREFAWDAAFADDTVVAVQDDRLLVWDLGSGKVLLATDPDEIPRRAGGLRSVAVGAGVAVAGTEGGYLLQWDLTDGRLLARTAAHGGDVNRLAISVDGTPIVLSIGGEDRWTQTLCFHDVDGLRRTGEVALAEDTGSGGWTVLDGRRRAVTVAFDGLLTVWDPTTAAPVVQFPTTTCPYAAPVFTAGGELAVLGEAGALRIVGLRDGTVRGTIRTDFTYAVGEVAVCGTFVFAAQSGSTEGRTNLLELTNPLARDDTRSPHFLDGVPATIGERPVVVALDQAGPFQVFDPADGRGIGEPIGERSNSHTTVGGHPTLRTVTVGGRDLVVVMSKLAPTTVDPATGETRTAPEPPLTPAVLSAAAARDGLIAAVDAGGTLAVWDAATLSLRTSAHVAGTFETTSVALGDLNGRAVVLTGTDGGGIRWFDGADLAELSPPGRFAERTGPPGHTVDGMNWPGPGAVTELEVVGTVVISTAGDTVTCADIATGDPSGPALVHPGKVWATLPAVLHGVPVIATSCDDRTLRVWEITTGRTLWTVVLPRRVYRILSVTADQFIVLDSGYLNAVAAPQDDGTAGIGPVL